MTIRGLHSCKPGNAPHAGDVKTLSIQDKTGKSGKAYKKITNDAGGMPYEIVSVEATGYTDDHGNVSFNLEVKPTGEPPRNGTQTRQDAPQRAGNGGMGDDRQNRIERQHSQEMALRYCAIVGEKNITTEKLRPLIDWFQRDIARQPLSDVVDEAVKLFKGEVKQEGSGEEIPF